jgi:hypothetical protein
VPGQEEGNARLIAETRSGAIAITPATVLSAVQEVIANDGRLWREWSASIAHLSRPRAPIEIAELLLEL